METFGHPNDTAEQYIKYGGFLVALENWCFSYRLYGFLFEDRAFVADLTPLLERGKCAGVHRLGHDSFDRLIRLTGRERA